MVNSLLDELTPAQRQAVTHVEGPCLVVAGAGTGKTLVITRRIAHLILNEGVSPEKILALTFTDKAAKEMEERVDIILPYGCTGTTISTFHSFCAELVRRHAFLLGINPQSRIVTTADEISILRRRIADLPIKLYKPSHNPVDFLYSLSRFASIAREEHVSPSEVLSYAAKTKELASDESEQEAANLLLERAHLYKALASIYAEEGILTYADLMFYAVELLENFPSARALEQSHYSHILIDEFQDTNTSQNLIARALVGNSGNIMAVGDDDQAIYAFRGANINNILQFSATYPNRKLITLTDNYRSSQTILDTANALIQHNNPDRLEVKEGIDKHLLSHSPTNHPIVFECYANGALESKALAERIQELITKEEYQPSEIAILTRARSQGRGVEAALKAAGIPCSPTNEVRLYEDEHVRNALRYLRFLCEPHNDINFYYLLRSPVFQVEESSLSGFMKEARYTSGSLVGQLKDADSSVLSSALKKAWDYLAETLAADHDKASQSLVRFLHDSGWYRNLVKKDDYAATEKLASLLQDIQQFEELHPYATLHDYIRHIDSLLATDQEIPSRAGDDSQAGGVQIMTMHKSKGLEFRAVFLPGLTDTRLPARNQSDPFPFPEDLTSSAGEVGDRKQEERRLAYVAMTRAKERLFLSYAEQYEERKTKSKPSPFVAEALGPVAPHRHESDSAQMLEPLPDSTYGSKDKTASTESLQLLRRLSASGLETYIQCPFKFRLQYINHLKVPSSGIANFGTSLHGTLQLWFQALRNGEKPDLESIYAQSWIHGGYENAGIEKERYDEGLQKLRDYLTSPLATSIPSAIEQSVQYRLPQGITITGKIDRIDINEDGSVRIVDYKTAERLMNESELAEHIPMTTYALATAQQGKPVATLEIHYIMRSERVSMDIERVSLDKRREEIEKTVADIQKSCADDDFPAKPHRILCGYCDYRDVCPFRYKKS